MLQPGAWLGHGPTPDALRGFSHFFVAPGEAPTTEHPKDPAALFAPRTSPSPGTAVATPSSSGVARWAGAASLHRPTPTTPSHVHDAAKNYAATAPYRGHAAPSLNIPTPSEHQQLLGVSTTG